MEILVLAGDGLSKIHNANIKINMVGVEFYLTKIRHVVGKFFYSLQLQYLRDIVGSVTLSFRLV